jgi:hypothetical protein
MAPRWLVVPLPAALERAEAPVNHARPREEAALAPHLFHLHAQRCETPERAHAALAECARRWTYHRVESCNLIEPQRYARQGRPTSHPPLQASAWHIQAHTRPDQEALAHRKPGQACVVLGTTIEASEWRDPEVLQADTGQSRVEGGFRLLQDPLFCVASWCVNKPCRLPGLWMGMTRALVVSSVTQRRRRPELAAPPETGPTHMHQPTAAPT